MIWNPHLYAGEMYAQSILYDTLVSITADGYEGCLAESWDISEDGCTYTFHIRPNVLFSDGEKCDANAILANFNAILENRERHTWRKCEPAGGRVGSRGKYLRH